MGEKINISGVLLFIFWTENGSINDLFSVNRDKYIEWCLETFGKCLKGRLCNIYLLVFGRKKMYLYMFIVFTRSISP